MIKRVIKHPLFSGSAIMVGGSLFANLINYVYHMVMGRVLGPVSYGVLASIFSLFYIINVVPVSSSFAIVKFISSAENAKKRVEIYHGIRKLILKVATVAGLTLVLLSAPISNFLHIENNLLILIIGPISFVSLLTLVNQSTSQGLLKFAGSVGPTLVSSSMKLILGLIFIYLGYSVLGAVFAMFLAAVLAYLSSIKYIRKLSKTVIKKKYNLRPFLRYAFPVFVQAAAFSSFFTIDLILVKHFLSPFDAGLYAALSTLGKIIFFAAQPITGVMFPVISGRRARGEGYRNVFYLSFAVTVGLSLIIVLFYKFFPQIAIGILYGEKYLSAKGELVWMGVFMLIYTVCYNLVNFLLSIDRTKIVALPLVFAIVQIVAIWFWHESILQVIQVSLMSVLFLFVGLAGYLGYNQAQRIYAKKKG